jgi:hypothetical protein
LRSSSVFKFVNAASGERSVIWFTQRVSLSKFVNLVSGERSEIFLPPRCSSVAPLSFASLILARTSGPP